MALLYGHRGAPATGEKENTLSSFERALHEGATALETDVHVTKDGHVVLSHDPDLRRVFGVDRVIAQSSREELALPTLRDLLDLAPGVPINVDIKQRGIESRVLDAIGKDAARVLLASFHADVLARVRSLGHELTGLSKDEVRRLLLPGMMLRLPPLRIVGKRAQVPLAYGRLRFDTRAFIDKCHALGLKVDYWTVNDVDVARRLVDLGADGIMSDDPGAVRAALQ